eukprot:365018-Chlamydomonas_euryale.AAC.11
MQGHATSVGGPSGIGREHGDQWEARSIPLLAVSKVGAPRRSATEPIRAPANKIGSRMQNAPGSVRPPPRDRVRAFDCRGGGQPWKVGSPPLQDACQALWAPASIRRKDAPS